MKDEFYVRGHPAFDQHARIAQKLEEGGELTDWERAEVITILRYMAYVPPTPDLSQFEIATTNIFGV